MRTATAATTCSKPKPATSKGRACFDSSGIPLHEDNESVIKERIYLDKADRNLLHDEITVTDHALTRPWTVMKNYRRNLDPLADWPEYNCNEQIPFVRIGNETYRLSPDGYLMPTRQNQPPPETRYFTPAEEMKASACTTSHETRSAPMLYRTAIGAVALAASLCVTFAGALAFDESKYPDWKGAWRRVAVPGIVGQPSYDPTKRGGAAQQAPLTPEYQAIFEANLKDQAAGGQGTDPTYTCLSPGMPRVMTTFDSVRNPGHAADDQFPDPAHPRLPPNFHRRARLAKEASSRLSSAIRSADGSIPTATAATTCWRSRRAD